MSDVTREELDRIDKAADDAMQLQAAFGQDDVVYHPFDPRDIKRLIAAVEQLKAEILRRDTCVACGAELLPVESPHCVDCLVDTGDDSEEEK